MSGFRDLKVWQRAKDLAVRLYQTSQTGDLARDFGLRDQLRRSAVSIASNIAEGYERHSDKEFQRFLFIAKGSLSELRTQLEIAHEIGSITKESYSGLDESCKKISAMLTNLIRARATQ